jgi:hypothetical protein
MFEVANTKTKTPSLSHKVIAYCDEFSDYCAFLCDTFYAVSNDNASIDNDVVSGILRSVNALKHNGMI